MRGSIQKKGNIYYAVVAVGPKRRWFKGGPTKKDAERVLTEKLGEIDNKTFADIPKTVFSEYCKIWFGMHVEHSLKPSTQKHYRDMLKPLKQEFEGRKLSDITTKELQLYIVKRLKAVSAYTIRSEIMLIKLLFTQARKWGYLRRSPAEDIEAPRYTKPEIDILQPDEIRTLLGQCYKERSFYSVAFRVDVETGLRAGELWGLQWEDIDWENGKVHVRRSLWRGTLQVPKTKNAMRQVDISESLLHELKKWKLACPSSEDDLVFPSQGGCRVNHENVMNRHFHPILEKAGIRHVSFHSLRHSNASLRIAASQNIKYISTQLGHASIKITLDTYAHLFRDAEFTRQQVGLLESTLMSVRSQLENPFYEITAAKENNSKTLELNNIIKAGI